MQSVNWSLSGRSRSPAKQCQWFGGTSILGAYRNCCCLLLVMPFDLLEPPSRNWLIKFVVMIHPGPMDIVCCSQFFPFTQWNCYPSIGDAVMMRLRGIMIIHHSLTILKQYESLKSFFLALILLEITLFLVIHTISLAVLITKKIHDHPSLRLLIRKSAPRSR